LYLAAYVNRLGSNGLVVQKHAALSVGAAAGGYEGAARKLATLLRLGSIRTDGVGVWRL
jgi:hypothetical protein